MNVGSKGAGGGGYHPENSPEEKGFKSSAPIPDRDLPEMPLQNLLLLVSCACIERQNKMVRIQLEEMDANNKVLAKLNKALALAQELKVSFPAQKDPETKVTLSQELKDALKAIGEDPDKIQTLGQLTQEIEVIRGKVDQVNSLSQTQATKLQMEINKLQVFADMGTNTTQTIMNAMKAIARNLA